MTEETALAYDIAIEELPTRRMASVTLHATQTQLSGLIGRAFGTIVGALQATGTKPAGPPLVVFHDMIDETTPGDVEVGIPVSMGTSGTSLGHDVAIHELAAGPAATTMHRGPYEDLGSAHQALADWIHDHGHEVTGPPREIYLNDPNQVEPDDLQTRIEWPVSA